MFAGLIQRPMGWSLIDALASIEEQEEILRIGEQTNDHKRDQHDWKVDC